MDNKWIKIEYRPMTKEEKEDHGIQDLQEAQMLNCQLPEDGQEVLITTNGMVRTAIFCEEYGECGFEDEDISDVQAWMPMPKPYGKANEREKTEVELFIDYAIKERCEGCKDCDPKAMYQPEVFCVEQSFARWLNRCGKRWQQARGGKDDSQ